MPLPLASATIKALSLCDNALREKLSLNVVRFWTALGSPPPEHLSPIVSLAPRNPETLRRRLLAEDLYPPLIQYPGGPANGYFRFAISSEHSAAQIDALAAVLT